MNLITELESLWKQHPAGPDLAAFFKHHSPSILDRLALLRRDQRLRWASPNPWLAEDYLQQLAPLPQDIDWALELAAGEWLSRPDEQALTAGQLEARFPQLTGLPAHLVRGPEKSRVDSRIDDVCDQYESTYRSGNAQPHLEYALANLAVEHRDHGLRQLVEVELEFRSQLLRPVTAEELLQKFPLYAALTPTILHAVRPDESLPTAQKPATCPATIGKYQILQLLGTGSFARVYLALQPPLNRKVALKVPLTLPPELHLDPAFDEATRTRELERYHRELELFREKMEKYRKEARLLAEMDHPALVRIYDVFDSEHEVPILVQEFVEGQDLRKHIQQHYRQPEKPVPIAEAIRLIMAICDGLKVTHQREIYHRDLKPANILLDRDGQPKIADFGLAVHASQLQSRANRVEGTLAYMPPEQIDGQTPRIDGRSDLWAVGVMLYEMLAARHPFRWEHSRDPEVLRRRIRASILETDPTPLRQLRVDIPEELDRICLRCLQPQKDKRIDSVRGLSEDLSALAAQLSSSHSGSNRPPVSTAPVPAPTPSPAPGPADSPNGSTSPGSSTAAEPLPPQRALKVSPRGLLAFTGAEQAEFLQLLSGVPDRHGLPPAVAFWKNRIEAGSGTNAIDLPFAVGLLYGPSGCGKTSLMRAGILPRLSHKIRAHYVEATVGDTEVRILKALRTTWPDLPQADLPELFHRLREQGQWLPLGQRLVVVIDQFEQWLHAKQSFSQERLTLALGQCDGERVQVILMIREDFCPQAEQLFSALGIRLDENHNRFRLKLFDQRHARKVMTLFGVAQEQLPENTDAQTNAQKQFLEQAIRDLSNARGEVISVQLALFVEMFGSRDWTPEQYREVGGVDELGVRFLEDSFRREDNRRYSSAAQRVLQELLPVEEIQDTDESQRIKGAMQSRSQLQQAAGGGTNYPDDKFGTLMDILEKSLRLITPTTPDAAVAG
ncbi:MAG: serine/threonine protein kinase, partial [Planctomycetaceae bacterium]